MVLIRITVASCILFFNPFYSFSLSLCAPFMLVVGPPRRQKREAKIEAMRSRGCGFGPSLQRSAGWLGVGPMVH